MIDKIKALLAMANDPGASEQERETAARQAGKLMAKHEIDEYDLLVASGKEYELIEMDAQGMRPGKKSGAKVPGWINVIAFGVKIYCGTRCTLGGTRLVFRGTRAGVELSQWMHNALVAACYAASRGQNNPNQWRNGYAGAIQVRLKKMAAEQVGEGSGTSLVVVRQRMTSEMDAKWGSESKAVSIRSNQSFGGVEAGKRAHIPTSRPMTDARVHGYLS